LTEQLTRRQLRELERTGQLPPAAIEPEPVVEEFVEVLEAPQTVPSFSAETS